MLQIIYSPYTETSCTWIWIDVSHFACRKQMTSGTTTVIWLYSFGATAIASYTHVSTALTVIWLGTASTLTLVLRLAWLLWAIVAVTRSILIPLRYFSTVIPLIYPWTLYLFVPDFQNDSCKNCNKTTQLCYIYESAYAAGVLDLCLPKQVHSKLSLNVLPLACQSLSIALT
jgi:hypothetical protein